jgi:exodeoxyribonuclease VII large subunit
MASRGQALERLGGRLAPLLPARLVHARGAIGEASAALSVLGPQATLERGYAIVRRTRDGAIIRDPGEAPPGTKLRLRVAHGELPATADPP